MNSRLLFVTMIVTAAATTGAAGVAIGASEPVDEPPPTGSEAVDANARAGADLDAVVTCRLAELVPPTWPAPGDLPGSDDPMSWRFEALGSLATGAALGDDRYAAFGEVGDVVIEARYAGWSEGLDEAMATLADECGAIVAEHGHDAAPVEPAAYDAFAVCLLVDEVPDIADPRGMPGINDPLRWRIHGIGHLGAAAALGDAAFADLGAATELLVRAKEFFDVEGFHEARAALGQACSG